MVEYSYRLHFKALNVLFKEQGLDPKMGVSPSNGFVDHPPPPIKTVQNYFYTHIKTWLIESKTYYWSMPNFYTQIMLHVLTLASCFKPHPPIKSVQNYFYT